MKLTSGDVHIIRNAGGVVTEDTIRCLVVSHYLLNTNEVILIHHTRCGMLAPVYSGAGTSLTLDLVGS